MAELERALSGRLAWLARVERDAVFPAKRGGKRSADGGRADRRLTLGQEQPGSRLAFDGIDGQGTGGGTEPDADVRSLCYLHAAGDSVMASQPFGGQVRPARCVEQQYVAFVVRDDAQGPMAAAGHADQQCGALPVLQLADVELLQGRTGRPPLVGDAFAGRQQRCGFTNTRATEDVVRVAVARPLESDLQFIAQRETVSVHAAGGSILVLGDAPPQVGIQEFLNIAVQHMVEVRGIHTGA